ncbi:hypothetical protein PHAVU_011G049100 [Phaseolus vulgaris]
MDEVPGSLGTSASFSLRIGQTMFSSASLLFMSLGVEFYSYTAFCYLVTIMGLVIPWSFSLALVDGYSVLLKCPIRQPGILLIIVVGDWFICYRYYQPSHWQQLAQQLVLWIFCSVLMGHFALQSSVAGIGYQQLWPFCHGFCLWHPLYLTFGYYPLCDSHLIPL